MALIDNRGRQIPFFVGSFTYESIATADFDPITTLHDARHAHPAVLNDSELGKYTLGGFLVRPNADGLIYGITWEAYEANKVNGVSVLTGLTPQAFLGLASQWIEVPFIKIYACNSAYTTVPTYINVASIC